MPLVIRDWPLPYVDRLAERDIGDVDLVVVHCTELPDLATARSFGERALYESGAGNSGHYYVDRDGARIRFVPEDRVAHHTRGYNERSIGIELVNLGRYPDWLHSASQSMTEPYPDAQLGALIELLRSLHDRLPTLRYIAGHEDLDTACVPASDDAALRVRRKLDPGPLFPWDRVLASTPLQRLTPSSA